jgi:hypothetical protein
MVKMRPARENAIRRPSGDQSGSRSSPRVSTRGSPPAAGTTTTAERSTPPDSSNTSAETTSSLPSGDHLIVGTIRVDEKTIRAPVPSAAATTIDPSLSR